MISKKYEKLVFSFVMSLFMSFIMAFAITIINIGLVDGFILKALEAWSKAFFVAFAAIVMVSPLVKKTVHVLVKKH